MTKKAVDVVANTNVSWMSRKRVWTFIALLVAFVRLCLFYFVPHSLLPPAWAWTTWHVVVGMVLFWTLHMARGTPFWGTTTEDHSEDTVWEQMDDGRPWTKPKKFFLVLVVLIFLVATHFSELNMATLAVNGIVLALNVIPKLPEMHHKRVPGFETPADKDQ